mmetsp:Transcript_6436/g.9049  ORF Transcript_6436/g.9049 Transcript_6436/m.9049 type:complete len:264 (+) Transcript_6436:49-840(+)|eukprot:CAMPEP_0197334286 /NCGR_PEP_ID=MMETSP0892-20130614/28872_1 /TAXON_ID=44058 ORGANISM="Aureoumbra lagunensis, Strain CCMP1510" /NCGR_SAMPLE_ID=MMETSP0892 /ASSEMBLY_ACC=CAM_ASM_000538 /LENGTH=263 /DNA_ID=CAMNT_0042834751 /DNA_START=44 /DNA_END=835 /DNA_ORIENTATION=+
MPAVFGDITKPALDILGDDYTKKILLKAKASPKSCPVGFTVEDEITSKGVDGTLTLKYKEPLTGITFDKLKLKGKSYSYEASKVIEGIKVKAKGDPTDYKTTSVSAEFKGPLYTLTAGADKSKISGSIAASAFAGAIIGGDATYGLANGSVAYNCGASYLINTIFASIVYSSKNIFSFALSWSPIPKLTVAASIDSDKKEPTVGLKYSLSPPLSIGAKTTKDTLSLVYVNKLGKDASIVLGAETKYKDMAYAKPTFGATITIG